MTQLNDLMSAVNGVVWGPVMVLLLVGTGVYLTIRLRFVQVRHFGAAVRAATRSDADARDKGDISPLQALAAALSATVGTGNIAGVATAIALGGPGAVFWMWVTAVVGMATKYTSCSLAVRYRVTHDDGTVSGGPMYFLAVGLGQRWLGFAFALFAGIASFGIGCAVQSNSVADAVVNLLPDSATAVRIPQSVPVLAGTVAVKPVIGVVLAFLVGMVILGGIKRIGRVAAAIVPFMCAVYLAGAFIILARNLSAVPGALTQIFQYAFTPLAAGGGFFGFVLQHTCQKGVARGVFSNESGLGSAPIAHAAARTHEMARQGLIAMLGPFIDTILVCSITALVILVTGAWQVRDAEGTLLYGPDGRGLPVRAEIDGHIVQVVGEPGADGQPITSDDGAYYPIPTGTSLTASAFTEGIGAVGKWIVALGICLFAYSTMISWSYYGDRCWEYMLGRRAIRPYRLVFCVFVVLGTIGGLDLVWLISDNLNALMAIPNLVGLLFLSGVAVRETRDYFRRQQAREAD